MDPVHDPAIIEDVSREETDTIHYYVECMAFFDHYLSQDDKLKDMPLRKKVEELLEYWCDDNRNPDCIEDASIDLLLFGMISQAIYFLQGSSGQFKKELQRICSDLDHIRSNVWLFYTASKLKRAGFEIEFIKELGQKTPDYEARRGTDRLFVEANTRAQHYQKIDEVAQALWELLHGPSGRGKQLKFEEAGYDPGLIVFDVSHFDLEANETRALPVLDLRVSAFETQNADGFVYNTVKDPSFFLRPQNNGNVISYAIDYFQQVNKSKYKVRALLIGRCMRLARMKGGIAAPKDAVLIVDHRFRNLVVQDLAKAVYLVEPEPIDIHAAVRDQLRLKANELWRERGKNKGNDQRDWFDARVILGIPGNILL